MDDIARHSGIAKPVYYRYFSDKAGLHLAVGVATAKSVVRQVTNALDQEGTVRSKLAAGIDVYLRVIEADPELYRFVVHSAPPSRVAATDPVDDYATVVGLHATRTFGNLLRQAGADAGAAEPWGFGVVGMIRSAADRWLEHPSMPRAALVGYLTDLVVPGLVSVIPDVVEVVQGSADGLGASEVTWLHPIAEGGINAVAPSWPDR
ncbi:MAG: TetR/AcrR family transcriptional regulator [Actinomycetota bacterium]|nr:TetR/AcrR family transcriptional regulator [Actinomycetota bacterium]